MAGGGDTNKKGGKGAPKLKRASRDKTKYSLQYARTYKNKLRRVRKCNGDHAANQYMLMHAPTGAERGPAKVTLPNAKALKHSVKR